MFVVLDVEGLDDEQLLAVQRLVLLTGDDVAGYASEEHHISRDEQT